MGIRITSDFKVAFTTKTAKTAKEDIKNANDYDEDDFVPVEDEEDIDISEIELLSDWD